MRLTLCFLLFFAAADAYACRVQPSEQVTPPLELVARTETIVLAVVTEATEKDHYRTNYAFRAIRHLKGDTTSEFEILGAPARTESVSWTFNDHQDEDFWVHDRLGRATMYPDCKIWPAFVVGETYLIFLGEPRHIKGFERVELVDADNGVRDKWLAYVEDSL